MTNILIYMTCGSAEEAERIATHLLEKSLVACANIMAPHKAIYKWEGKIETGEEASMILKTQGKLFEQVRAEVCSMHSYDCPCIVSVPIEEGHKPFLQWINEQTS